MKRSALSTTSTTSPGSALPSMRAMASEYAQGWPCHRGLARPLLRTTRAIGTPCDMLDGPHGASASADRPQHHALPAPAGGAPGGGAAGLGAGQADGAADGGGRAGGGAPFGADRVWTLFPELVREPVSARPHAAQPARDRVVAGHGPAAHADRARDRRAAAQEPGPRGAGRFRVWNGGAVRVRPRAGPLDAGSLRGAA